MRGRHFLHYFNGALFSFLLKFFFVIMAAAIPVYALADDAPESLVRNLNSFNHNEKFAKILVERVISADTIQLPDGKKIRLIGLKAPQPPPRPKQEYDKNGLPIEAPILPENTYEEKAYAFASNLLLGKTVRLEFDESRADDDFVTVAYVFLTENQTFANTEILRYGYADLQIKPPNLKYEEDLREAYQEARREKRGLHSN